MNKLKIVITLAVFLASIRLVAQAVPEKSPHHAEKIMMRCVRNTHALRRFICTMEVQVQWLGNMPSVMSVEKVRVVYDGPRRIAVRELSFNVSGGNVRDKAALEYPRYYHEIVADGTRYYALDAYQKQYVLRKLNVKGLGSETQAAGIFSDFTFGGLLFPNGYKEGVAPTTNVKVMGVQTLDNTVCDKIYHSESNLMPDGSKQKTDSLYWISRKDGLLRRVETKSPSTRIVENYHIQQVGGVVKGSEFLIKPPASAKQVKSFE